MPSLEDYEVLMFSLHTLGLNVPAVSCSRPTKVCSDPVKAAALRTCSPIALTPVTWTSQTRYKHKFQFQLFPYCVCFF